MFLEMWMIITFVIVAGYFIWRSYTAGFYQGWQGACVKFNELLALPAEELVKELHKLDQK